MTWKDVNSNLSKRSGSSLNSLVEKDVDAPILILNSSNDIGVIRNGGRRGAAFGPKALCANLLKLAKRNFTSALNVETLCTPQSDTSDFNKFQAQQSSKIQEKISSKRECVIHLGGGHDHAYPFVDAIIKEKGDVTVINLDAHLDTRDDELRHSGTPFRQLKEEHQDKLELIQIGIHDFANVCENYEKLDMEIHTVNEIKALTKNYSDNKSFVSSILSKIDGERTIILSLDMDAIDGSEMPAVSAVNHDGLPMTFIREFYEQYGKQVSHSYLGIYEYNPLYDNLGCSSARSMASTLYNYLISKS